jgi:hypothetical protein
VDHQEQRHDDQGAHRERFVEVGDGAAAGDESFLDDRYQVQQTPARAAARA